MPMSLGAFRSRARKQPQAPAALAIVLVSGATSGNVNQPYAGATWQASGGTQPYTFSVSPAGDSPQTGLSLSQPTQTTALLSGTPTIAATRNVKVRVTDGAGATVDSATLSIVTTALSPELLATNAAELIALVDANLGSGSPVTILLADGGEAAYGTTSINLAGRNATSLITIRSQNKGPSKQMVPWRTALANLGGNATLPGVSLIGSNRIAIEYCKLHRNRVVTGTAADPTYGVVRLDGATNCKVRFNEISSTDLPTADFHGYMTITGRTGTFQNGEEVRTSAYTGVPDPTAIGGRGYIKTTAPQATADNLCIRDVAGLSNPATGQNEWANYWAGRTLTGQDSGATATVGSKNSNVQFINGITFQGVKGTNNEITDNWIHDVKWGIAHTTSGNIERNLVEDYYNAPWDAQQDCSDCTFKDNWGQRSWANSTDGQAAGTDGPHSSVGGFSFEHWIVRNWKFIGNIGLTCTDKGVAVGRLPVATGNKYNDAQDPITASIAPEAGNPGFSIMTVTSIGTSWQVHVDTLITGTLASPISTSNRCRVTAQLTGTAGKTGTYRVDAELTVASRTLYAHGQVVDGQHYDCITDTNGSIGNEYQYWYSGDIGWNTIFQSRDLQAEAYIGGPFKPNYIAGNIGDGVKIHHQVSLGSAAVNEGTSGEARYVSQIVKESSLENFQLSLTETTGAGAFEANYDGVGGGTPFNGLTLQNVMTMLNPKTGGPVAVRKMGAGAWYNWADGTNTRPAFAGKRPTVATGQDLSAVRFDGTKWARYTAQGTETWLDLTSGDLLMVMIDVLMQSPDTADLRLFDVTGGAFTIRRLPAANNSTGNRVRMTVENDAGTVILQYDSRFWLRQGERALLLFGFKLSTGEVFCMKNDKPDGMGQITTMRAGAMRLTDKAFTAMGNSSTTAGNLVTGDVQRVYAANEFLNPALDQAAMTRLVALDGKPLDWGADGVVVTGNVPKLYTKGNAAYWGGADNNTGSAVRNLTPSAPLTDV